MSSSTYYVLIIQFQQLATICIVSSVSNTLEKGEAGAFESKSNPYHFTQGHEHLEVMLQTELVSLLIHYGQQYLAPVGSQLDRAHTGPGHKQMLAE